MSPPRVCYLGAYDPAYPRNLILRRGLAMHGVEVSECRTSPAFRTWARARALRRQFASLADRCDTILLAEFNQTLAWFARSTARRHRKRLVIDAFTSVYDAAVHDRGIVRPRSLHALRYWLIDWLALRLADVVLVDTARHRDYFAEVFGVAPGKCLIIPVGASREWFDTPPASHDMPGTLVLFYGTYIPLHGAETILKAATSLRERRDIHFELIGRGQTFPETRKLAAILNLSNVTFRDPVPPDELPGLVARADICLGIFGTTHKAGRVVPNKVYQALAMGKPLITTDTPALRDTFTPGEHLLAVVPGDARALAEAIGALADDPVRREQIGTAGRARMEAAFTEEVLGLRLREALW